MLRSSAISHNLVCILATGGLAQQQDASLKGQVTDDSDAAVPHAVVLVTDE